VQGKGQQEERHLDGRGPFRSGGVGFHRQAFLSQHRNSRSTQKQRPSRGLSSTSQLVDRQLQLALSLQVVVSEVETGRQATTSRATRNPCHKYYSL
jgi:hypothetical protein